MDTILVLVPHDTTFKINFSPVSLWYEYLLFLPLDFDSTVFLLFLIHFVDVMDGGWTKSCMKKCIKFLIFTKSVGAGSETTIIASLTGWAMLSGFIHSAICLKNLGCHPWGGWTSWIWPASGTGCGRVDGLSFCNGWNRSGSLPDLRWCSFSGFCSLLSDLYGGEALKDAQKDWWDGKRCRGLLRKILDVPWSVRYRISITLNIFRVLFLWWIGCFIEPPRSDFMVPKKSWLPSKLLVSKPRVLGPSLQVESMEPRRILGIGPQLDEVMRVVIHWHGKR